MLAAVAVAGGSGSSTPPAVYAITIGSQADALGLTGTQFAAPTATKDGVPIAITAWAWAVSGPATLDDDEIERPTPTHTGAGTCTRKLVATLADGATVTETDDWRVGTTGGWVLLWSTANAPDGNLKTTSPITVNGRSLYSGDTGGADSLALSGGVIAFDSNAGGTFPYVYVYPSEVLASPRDVHVCFMVGMTAGLNNDQICHIKYESSSRWVAAYAQKTGGVQKSGAGRYGSPDDYNNTSGGGQVRVLSLELTPGRYSARAKYRTTAWADNASPPSPDDLTLMAGGPPSGWFSIDISNEATADLFAPNTVPGAYGADKCQVAVSGGNTILSVQFAMWAKVSA